MLRISIKPSRRLALVLCAAHAAVAGTSLVLGLPMPVKIALVLLIGTSWGICLYGPALLRSNDSVIGLELKDDGAVSFQTRSGEWREGRLLGSSFVSPYLTILNLRSEDRFLARHVVIVPDSVDAEEFRRLRVRLRWGVHPSVQPGLRS